MSEKIMFIVLIAMVLFFTSWIGYYTNWFIHYTVILYGWMPIIVVNIGVLLFFGILIWEV